MAAAMCMVHQQVEGARWFQRGWPGISGYTTPVVRMLRIGNGVRSRGGMGQFMQFAEGGEHRLEYHPERKQHQHGNVHGKR